jgi:peptide/nickel transport system permease protein
MGGAEAAMRNYVIQRILATIPVMGVVVLFVFLLLRLAPGDPAALIAGDYAAPEDIAKIRVALGLDKPMHVQLGIWLAHLARADLGTSIYSKLPVTHLMAQRLEPTLALTLTTLVFAVSLAVPLGVLAAWKAGTWVDRAVMILAVAGFSLPVFWLGFLFIYGFSIKLAILPVQGFVSITEGVVPFLQHMVLPTLTLGTVYMALIARMTRASVLEVLSQDYIRTAHAKGVARLWVLWRHALKNAAVPIVTIIGIGVALLIGGVVVTESVFAIPGLGRLTVDAILHRDYPVIQGIILVFSAVYVLINLLVDLSYTVLNPRIRY